MLADFVIRNNGPQSIKDVEIRCTHSANSGTAIDSNTRTIYEIVKPHAVKRVLKFSMGFISDQATSSSCVITDFTLAP